MLVLTTIVSAGAILSLVACESVDLKLLYSEHRISGSEIDYYFLCTVCSPYLQWYINRKGSGGFMSSFDIGTVRSSNRANLAYWSVLLENARNEKNEDCLTSLILMYINEIPRVECRSENLSKSFTEFVSDSANNRSVGRVNADYVSFDETVFSGRFNHSYIFRCEVQSGGNLSWHINGNRVQTLTADSELEHHDLIPSNEDIFSYAISFTNHPSPDNSLTSILLLSIVDSSKNFNVSCQADDNEEEIVDFDLPLQSDSRIIDTATADSNQTLSMEGRTSSIEELELTSTYESKSTIEFEKSTPSPPRNFRTILKDEIIAVICITIFVIIFAGVLLLIFWCSWRKVQRNQQLRQQKEQQNLSQVKVVEYDAQNDDIERDFPMKHGTFATDEDIDRVQPDGPKVVAPTEEDEDSSEGLRGFLRRRKKV